MISYDYYRIFYYVVQYKSFTKAAEILHNNQPNITRCMNNLEAELGCSLFIRNHRGVTLTPIGEKLYEHVAAACSHLEAGEEAIQEENQLESGMVSIGASETALQLVLLDRLLHFRRQYPGIHIRITSHSTPQALTALKNGLVDLAVVTTPIHIKKPLCSTSLYDFREILIGGSDYEKEATQKCSLADLAGYPLISLGNDTSTWELYTEYYLKYNLPFHPDMEAATADQILSMVKYNLGIGFYPENLALESIKRKDTYAFHLQEPCPNRKVCLVQNEALHMSKAARMLIHTLIP